MSENSIPYQSSDGDVIQFSDNLLYRVGNFKRAIDRAFADSIGEVLSQQLDIQGYPISDGNLVSGGWTDSGIDVEILSVGSIQWQPAKIKLKLSFELVERSTPIEPIDLDIPSGILNDLEHNISSLVFNSVNNDSDHADSYN
jgi:hypothetical protein